MRILDTAQRLQEIMKSRVMVIDGATGTMIQMHKPTADDFGGEELEGCNENLNLTRPDLVRQIHIDYLEAGADFIETNTFGGTPLVLAEYGLADKAYEINKRAAEIAKDAASQYQDRFVAGSMGPTTKSIIVTRNVDFQTMKESYFVQAKGLLEGGADVLFVETAQDTLNVKSALVAIKEAEEETGISVPIFVSASVLQGSRMLAGQDIDAFYATIEPFDVFAVGLNCMLGPKDLRGPLMSLNKLNEHPTFFFPNAGLPNEHGEYDETPESFSDHIHNFSENGLLNVAGGCCGTTPSFISQIKKKLEGVKPRQLPQVKKQFTVSNIDRVVPDDKIRPILVGERSNVQGSRRFKELIRAGKYEEALEVTRQQVQSGSQILDICLEDTEFKESDAINTFYPLLSQAVKLPIMIDSTSPDSVELALQYTQGKSIINSMNLESGFEKLERLIGIMKKYGAAAVVGLIDEVDGMALSFDKKMEVVDRFYDLLVNKYGIEPSDIIFDLLVFTVDSGTDERLKGTAQATINAIKAVKEKYPEVMTILGISNVSFGLPPAGREVLNSVFLHHCVQAGLDLAIVNPATIIRYAAIPKKELEMAERILKEQSLESLQEFSNHFRDKAPGMQIASDESLTPDESLKNAIVMGIKSNVISDLDKLLVDLTPLEIINTVIMEGMGVVGKLFERAEMIVTEVLQSAEVVKLAIRHLEPMIKTGETYTKKTVILATVKGDVHDIGKNLVRIILESNGYKVIDLGIRVDSQTLINKIREFNPDAVGLSGLLVKSSRYMVDVAIHLKQENIELPLLVGGAALTEKFTENDIKPEALGPVFYARDAMMGLSIVNQIFED